MLTQKTMKKTFLSASYFPPYEMLLPLILCHGCRLVARLVNQ